ncbi:MAG: hypothetical protein MI922_24725 [Bacteroidales bacterium]|nr:hypothetical protein [Bacteroidales bacterium]
MKNEKDKFEQLKQEIVLYMEVLRKKFSDESSILNINAQVDTIDEFDEIEEDDCFG